MLYDGTQTIYGYYRRGVVPLFTSLPLSPSVPMGHWKGSSLSCLSGREPFYPDPLLMRPTGGTIPRQMERTGSENPGGIRGKNECFSIT